MPSLTGALERRVPGLSAKGVNEEELWAEGINKGRMADVILPTEGLTIDREQ